MTSMMTAEDTVVAVRELQSAIRARAGDIEQARRPPDDLVADLTAAGCYRLFAPESTTGRRCDYRGGLRAIGRLPRPTDRSADRPQSAPVGELAIRLCIADEEAPDRRARRGRLSPKVMRRNGDG